MPNATSHRLRAALAVLCLAALCFLGCAKQSSANPPTPTASPYVRLATYNAIVSEANLAAVKAVRSAADLQVLPPEITRQIFAWQERVARSSKTLAVTLSDSTVDVKSLEITNLVLDLAAPPVFDLWLKDLDTDQQRLVLSSLRALASAIGLMVREFGTREGAGLSFAPLHPARANADAWVAANEAEVRLGVPPQPGRLQDFTALWQRAYGYAGGAL